MFAAKFKIISRELTLLNSQQTNMTLFFQAFVVRLRISLRLKMYSIMQPLCISTSLHFILETIWKLNVNHRSLKALKGIQLKSHWSTLCKCLPEYSLAEFEADGCNRFSISRSLVVRFLVWRNKNSIQTIATTATHSVDLERKTCHSLKI